MSPQIFPRSDHRSLCATARSDTRYGKPAARDARIEPGDESIPSDIRVASKASDS